MDTVCLAINNEFCCLNRSWVEVIKAIGPDLLYQSPKPSTSLGSMPSVGEAILKSAGIVEQTFGGLTTNLWDDPFEWTLPETLTTPMLVEEYLSEVEATRLRGFAVIQSDADLYKGVSIPAGQTVPLINVLIQALTNASRHHGFAALVFRMVSNRTLPAAGNLA